MNRLIATCAAIVLLGSGSLARAQFDMPNRPGDTTSLEKMRAGTVSYASDVAKHERLINDLARWLAHRLVHPPFNGKEADKKAGPFPEDIETLTAEVNRWCTWPNPNAPPNAMQVEFAKALGKELSTKIMEVYDQTDNRLVRVNAARMLSVIGRLPYEGLADVYLKMIRDKSYPDEIKLFAFQGLRSLLSITDPITPTKHFITSNEKLAEIAKELENYITFKSPANLSPDQARVIQYIRREAVRALAQFKVGVVRQQQVALAKPVVTLLRVATNDRYVPAGDQALPGYGFHIMEQIDAVIGITSMVPDKSLNMDVVAWMLNDAMDDISKFQAKDRSDFQKDMRNKPLVPWKVTAVRLLDGYGLLKKNLAGLPPRLNPKTASDYCDLAIKTFYRVENEGVNAQPDYGGFRTWKTDAARKPKAGTILVDDDTTKVELK